MPQFYSCKAVVMVCVFRWIVVMGWTLSVHGKAPVKCVGGGGADTVPAVKLHPSFAATVFFLDAAINSHNALSAFLRKEAYRVKIASFNNPASPALGFRLDTEIRNALQPLLAKTRTVQPQKFTGILTTLLFGTGPPVSVTTSLTGQVLPAILSLVGNLAIQEKHITRDDVDSFARSVSRYFRQYEQLNTANQLFTGHIERLASRLRELGFDLREYAIDFALLARPDLTRAALRSQTAEEILLLHLDPFRMEEFRARPLVYPADGIRGAKEIAGVLQKLFADYQQVYDENYRLVRAVLMESKLLGRQVNLAEIETSLREVESLYRESRTSDELSLRIQSLSERLQALVQSEQVLVPTR